MKYCFFDIESTGPDASKDRIVQLAIYLEDEQGNVLLDKSKMYNPKMEISARATEVHKITNAMVEDAPEFSEDARKLKKIFENSVLVVYNGMQFDIPMLLNEFERAGVTLDLSGEVIDVMRLETALSPRTLSAVYERYTGKPLEDAHDATADVKGTKVVLQHQLAKIKKEKLDRAALLKGCGVPEGSADFFGKLTYLNDGRLAFNFGKHKGIAVLSNEDTKQYATWMTTQNFPTQVKRLLQDELKKDVAQQFKKKPEKKDQGFYPMRKQTKTTELFNNTVGSTDDDLPF
jgi:DNA polymerase III subunit epsilon